MKKIQKTLGGYWWIFLCYKLIIISFKLYPKYSKIKYTNFCNLYNFPNAVNILLKFKKSSTQPTLLTTLDSLCRTNSYTGSALVPSTKSMACMAQLAHWGHPPSILNPRISAQTTLLLLVKLLIPIFPCGTTQPPPRPGPTFLVKELIQSINLDINIREIPSELVNFWLKNFLMTMFKPEFNFLAQK